MPELLEIALSDNKKIDYIHLVQISLNPEGYQNCVTASKVIAISLEGGGNFAYKWSCIGKCLRLQPTQQACFIYLQCLIPCQCELFIRFLMKQC